jgi:UDPglucose 6-dehydrogenase/GDP-mannose 6-dehydrogenase
MIVTIVGTGYVGLVTGACLVAQGHTVHCVDVSPERVAQISAGEAPFYEPGLEELLRDGLASGRLSASTDLRSSLEGSALSLIAVGTPGKAGSIEPDLSYLETAAAQIGTALPALGGYHVVAVKSTVIPGTTRRVVQKAVEAASGMKLGEFGLCMNPEFLREGSAVADFQNPDRIVIGQADSRSGDFLDDLYRSFECEKLRVSLEEAELTKYASNAFLSLMISFSNELAGLCEATAGVDLETVMEGLYLDRRLSPAAAGSRIRPEILTYLRAGIGFGGSCLPKDVNALRTYGQRTGVPTPLLDAVMDTNTARPSRVVRIAQVALGSLEGKTIALLGVAFKAGTDDLRSSPALSILRALRAAGARVVAYDPVVTADAASLAGLNGTYRETLEAAVADADAAVLTTTDVAFRDADWARLSATMRTPVVIDGRNVLRRVPLPAKVRYYPIGKGPELAEAQTND